MRRVLSLAALSILALSASASAQRSGSMINPSPEIGMDAGISFGLGTPQITTVSIPAQHIRMGFFVSPALSIEPMLGIVSVSGDAGSGTVYNLGVGALYHFATSRAANQFYVRPFVNIVGFSGEGTSDSEAVFGVGVREVRLEARRNAVTQRDLESAADGSDGIGLLAGLSFYTR
jgi:hypothetical protein